MEVVDRLGWDEMYVFDLNIHYDAERSMSTYKMATRGLPDFVKYFGDTKLSIVTDFDAQLYFIMDQVQGKDLKNNYRWDNDVNDLDNVCSARH